jgi:hypothetical protein
MSALVDHHEISHKVQENNAILDGLSHLLQVCFRCSVCFLHTKFANENVRVSVLILVSFRWKKSYPNTRTIWILERSCRQATVYSKRYVDVNRKPWPHWIVHSTTRADLAFSASGKDSSPATQRRSLCFAHHKVTYSKQRF